MEILADRLRERTIAVAGQQLHAISAMTIR
jgi:hypothetical protein